MSSSLSELLQLDLPAPCLWLFTTAHESVWKYNLVLGLLQLVVIKGIVIVCDYVCDKGWISKLASRKLIHLSATCLPFLWPYYIHVESLLRVSKDRQPLLQSTIEFSNWDVWSYRFNAMTGIVYGCQLLVEGYFFPNPDDPNLKVMTRTGNPLELCLGPLFFAMVLVYVGLYQFRTRLSCYFMGCMGFGDFVAPLVGTQFPYGTYPTYSRDATLKETKSLAGSFAMFVGSILGMIVLEYALLVRDDEEWRLDPDEYRNIVGIAITATTAEAISGQFDNLVIVICVAVYAHFSGVLM